MPQDSKINYRIINFGIVPLSITLGPYHSHHCHHYHYYHSKHSDSSLSEDVASTLSSSAGVGMHVRDSGMELPGNQFGSKQF